MKRISVINSGAGRLLALFIVLASVFFSSCKKDIYDEFDQSVNNRLVLSASKDSLVLNEANFAADALEFYWTAGSNFATNNAISYKFYIDKQGNNFQNAIVADLGKSILQKKYSVQDFNSMLLSQLSLTADAESILEAKIVSQVAGTNYTDSTTKTIKVTPYKPVSNTLYMLGDATPSGWSADNATELTKNASYPGRFSKIVNLTPGEFKFITSKGQFTPSYNRGATASQLVYRSSDTQPDNKFVVTEKGAYTISVNLLDLTVTMQKGAMPPFSELWIVGDATPNGWNIDNPNQLRVDRSDPFIFSYNEVLKAGEFKFPTAKGNWGGDFYMPLVANQDLSLTAVSLVKGGNPDNKWKITTPGAYKITLNTTPGAEKIDIKTFTVPAALYVVGDATSAGWNIDNPIALVKDANDPYKFIFTGALKAGELKFPVAKGDWGADFYMPVVNGEDATSTEVKFIAKGNPDNKWKITSAEAGNYKITVDVLHETISFEKQ
jgi:starch-binding outer membrane protein SusE/F